MPHEDEVRVMANAMMDALHNPHTPRPKGEWVGGEITRQYVTMKIRTRPSVDVRSNQGFGSSQSRQPVPSPRYILSRHAVPTFRLLFSKPRTGITSVYGALKSILRSEETQSAPDRLSLSSSWI